MALKGALEHSKKGELQGHDTNDIRREFQVFGMTGVKDLGMRLADHREPVSLPKSLEFIPRAGNEKLW